MNRPNNPQEKGRDQRDSQKDERSRQESHRRPFKPEDRERKQGEDREAR